ncbi:hypothetical protein CPC08DRAFT_755311 [Agrocybe pediades]|nr:hypothetical protein CPC08DRAFT_755311 [Agrocybe pediades]
MVAHTEDNSVARAQVHNTNNAAVARAQQSLKVVQQPKKRSRTVAAIPRTVPNLLTDDDILSDKRFRDVFNPTLTHALYTSDEPFLGFCDGDSFESTVQLVFDLSFPNIRLDVGDHKAILHAAQDRVKTRRSKLAKAVLDDVQKFFSSSTYKEHPSKIRDYVCWALSGGPAYFASPVPQGSTAKKGDINYVAPQGFLQSIFIADIAKKFMRYVDDSALTPPLSAAHPPRALYALILVAVERAFTSYISGAFIQPENFSHENYWEPLKVFRGKVDLVSERAWREILAFGCEDTAAGENGVDHNIQSMISAYRADIDVPLSP